MTLTTRYHGGTRLDTTDNGGSSFKVPCGGFHLTTEASAENIIEAASSTVEDGLVTAEILTGPNGELRLRVNGADGNLVMVITASSGDFEDNTNTDSVGAGDTISFEEHQPTGMHGDTIRCGSPKVNIDTARPFTGTQSVGIGAQGIGGTIRWNGGPKARDGNNGTSETAAQDRYAAETWDNLRVNVDIHGGSNVTWRPRDDGADMNLVVTLTATGQFADTTNSDTPAGSSHLAYEFDCTADTMADAYRVSMIQIRTARAACIFSASVVDLQQSSEPRYWFPRNGNEFTTLLSSDPSTRDNIVFDAGFQAADLLLRCQTIGAGDTWTVRDRVEGADGNVIVTITATGDFNDETNTTDYAATDHYAMEGERTVDVSATNLALREIGLTYQEIPSLQSVAKMARMGVGH